MSLSDSDGTGLPVAHNVSPSASSCTAPSASEAALHQWPRILSDLAGVNPDLLDGRHHPCPACGGTDRFRFDDIDGRGTWFCSHCGGRDGGGGGGGGFALLERVKGWPFKQAAQEVERFLGLPSTNGNGKAPRRVATTTRAAPGPAPAPLPAETPVLAMLAEPITVANPYRYGPLQSSARVLRPDGGKRFDVQHRTAPGAPWKRGAGPDPWPILNEQQVLEAVQRTGGWPVEIEGEKCAGIGTAQSVAFFTHPGHAHKANQIRERYARLKEAGAPGIIIVADSGDPDRNKAGKPITPEGIRRARLSIEAAAAVGLPALVLHAAEVWPELEGIPGASIDDVPGDPADAILRLEQAAQAEHRRTLSAPPPPQPQPPAPPSAHPFEFLGMEGEAGDRGSAYAYLIPSTGQLLRLSTTAHTSLNLCNLAPIAHWEAAFPTESGKGINWTAAASDLMQRGKRAGAFDPTRIRGRGVWIDGDSIVHHLGDGLTVDGQHCDLNNHGGRLLFPLRAPLALEPTDAPLSDAEGRQLLDLFHRLQWRGASDHLYLAGAAVIGPVCGALPVRPQFQIEGDTSSGKSVMLREVLRPLWGGEAAAHYFAKATAAGIRQSLGADALPVLVDESEQEDHTRRAEILNLARHAYDATPIPRGTTHGKAIVSTIRTLMVLAGINATIPEAADRNRFVVLTRGNPDRSTWEAVYGDLTSACTPKVGARLVRRTTAHLGTLLSDASHLRPAIAGMLPGRTASRWADTIAPVLAGARLLTTTAPLGSAAEALAWLDSVGWVPDIDADDLDPAAEPRRCLDHLLSYSIPWRIRDNPSDSITVRELLTTHHVEAPKVLGRHGIRSTDCALLVASGGGGIARIYGGTRWANGAHTNRLRGLPGADAFEARIPGQASKRCTWIPLVLLSDGGT